MVAWLMAARALVHNGCTTGAEAYAMGVPAISYRPRVNEDIDQGFYRLPNQLSHQCFSYPELRETLGRILNGELGAADGRSASRSSTATWPPATARWPVSGWSMSSKRFRKTTPNCRSRRHTVAWRAAAWRTDGIWVNGSNPGCRGRMHPRNSIVTAIRESPWRTCAGGSHACSRRSVTVLS